MAISGSRSPERARRCRSPECQDQGPPDRGLGMEQDGVHLRELAAKRPLAGLRPPSGRSAGARRASRRALSSAAIALGSAPSGFSQLTMKLRSRGSGLCRKQGPDGLGLAHADQGHRRPCLTLGQSILDRFLDHRTMPDRGRDQSALGRWPPRRRPCAPGDNPVWPSSRARSRRLVGTQGIERDRLHRWPACDQTAA